MRSDAQKRIAAIAGGLGPMFLNSRETHRRKPYAG